MARLGEPPAPAPRTFSGLAGMGDLIVHVLEQARTQPPGGELIAQGCRGRPEAADEIGQTVEGLATAARFSSSWPHRVGVELPITEGVCAVLSWGRASPNW